MDPVFAFFILTFCFAVVAKLSRISKQTENLPGSPTSESVTLAIATPASQDWRRDAILEAIRRDPTLAQDTTPDTLARLDAAVGAIEREMVLREEVEKVLSEQNTHDTALTQAQNDREQFNAKIASNGNAPLLGATLEMATRGNGMMVSMPGLMGEIVIQPGSPAERAGLKPGDILLAINETDTGTIYDVKRIMAALSLGDEVSLHVRRESSDLILEVDL